MKRVLTFILVLSMIFGSIGMSFADTAVDSATYAEKAIAELVELKLVEGDEGGLRLEDSIKRSEVAVFATRLVGLEDIAKNSNYQGIFSDVSPTMWDNPVMNGAINVAAGKGFVKGYPDGTYLPENEITNAEIITIMVRLVSSEEEIAELDKGVWPAAYITKAAELGLLEGANIANYGEAATRETVFVLGYNAYTDRVEEEYYIFKAIVLENNRVERIGSDEVVVEVIKEVQRAEFAEESRKEKGDQERYVIDAKVGDVEDLLGKVVDITLDKNNKVIKVTQDDTYKYLQGPVTATRSKLTLNNTSYTVELDERYRGSDERIFRTYYNDDAYKYEDFYQDVETIKNVKRPEEFKADYARFTVKNGKVLFIDAFTFEDIAPVKDVRRDGQDVYVYNDYRDAREEKFEPRALVVGFNDGKFSRISREDIAENDVVHVYNKTRLIVRQDAIREGEYTKVERKTAGYFAHVGDGSYKINNIDYKRPVYAHDSKSFTTLLAANAQEDLKHFFREDVVVLIDVNDDLQLFGADIEYNEGMALVEQILARGQGRFVVRSNDRIDLDETFNSKISEYNLNLEKSTTNQRLYNFDRYDLVFVKGDGNNIDNLVRIATREYMEDNLKELASTEAKDMNNSFIKMKDNAIDRYQVLDRTNVFVIDGKNNILATSVEKLQKSLRADSTIKVFVLSDRDINAMVDENGRPVIVDRNRITNEANLAHTLVFFRPDVALVSDGETVYVTNTYTARTPHYVVGNKADNVGKTQVERTAKDRNVDLTKMGIGDIVSLKLTKDDDKLIQDWDSLIKASAVNTESYRVVGGDINYASSEYRRLVLADANGDRITKWLVRNAEEFGTITLDSVVTFHEDRNGDIDVIRVYSKTQPVTKNAPDINYNIYPMLKNVYQRLNREITIAVEEVVNGKVVENEYSYVGGQTLSELIALERNTVTINKVSLKGETVVNLVEKRTIAPPTDQEKAAVVQALINALPALEDLTLENEALVAEARAAYNALTAAQKELVSEEAVEALKAAEAKIEEFGEGEDPEVPEDLTAELIITENALIRKFLVTVRLSDETLNNKVTGFVIDGENYEVKQIVADGRVQADVALSAAPVKVTVVLDELEVPAVEK